MSDWFSGDFIGLQTLYVIGFPIFLVGYGIVELVRRRRR